MYPGMSDTIGDAHENNIKPEEEKVEKRSGRGFRRGLLFTLLAMFFVSAVVAIGVGIHVVVARDSGRGRVPAASSSVPVGVAHLQTNAPLSEYVRPL